MRIKSRLMVLPVMFFVLLISGCGGGGGNDSSPATGTPAPDNVVAAAGHGEATISWDNVTGATSYNIYYDNTTPVKISTAAKITGATSPRIITGLTNGTTYHFVVTAVGPDGESAASDEASATPTPNPIPSVPTNVTPAAGHGEVSISWDNVTGATSYNIYYDNTTPVTKAASDNIIGATNPKVVTGLTNGTKYYFAVTAVNANGESGLSSEVFATPTNAPAPPAPASVSAAPDSGGATVTWSPSTGATSYNIYYSTSSSVSKTTGTKVAGATTPKAVTGLIRGIPYYFVVTALNSDNVESGESTPASAIPNPPNPTFGQSDLTGTWNLRVILTGASPGWYGITATFDGSGNVTGTANQVGTASLPVPTLSVTSGTGTSAGVVKEGSGGLSEFFGKMSTSKNLIVGTSTRPGGTFALYVFVKRVPGVTFSSADLANTQIAYQRIYTGSFHNWERATGWINGSGQLALLSLADSSSPSLPLPPATGISVDNTTGIVSITNESSFSGMMTPDKKLIVGGSTDDTGIYSLRIIQMRGQTYTQADLAGENHAFAFISASTSLWARGIWLTVGNDVTVTSILDSDGNTIPPAPFTQVIDAAGNVPVGSMLSYGKDLLVGNGAITGGSYIEIKVQ